MSGVAVGPAVVYLKLLGACVGAMSEVAGRMFCSVSSHPWLCSKEMEGRLSILKTLLTTRYVCVGA